MTDPLETLRWKKFPVLNDGFVCLVDVMGDDSSVVQAARVSYGQDDRCNREDLYADEGKKNLSTPPLHRHSCQSTTVAKKTKKDKDRILIRYLMRHRHTTPFEMAEIKLLVRVPMDCWRQWIRHRMANVNEYSTRYTEAIDSQQTTLPREWRLQSGSNKQGSSGYLEEWPDNPKLYSDDRKSLYLPDGPRKFKESVSPGALLCDQEELLHTYARQVYESRLELGVAKEQARKDLPLSTYTEAYWKIDLHNLLHFISLRMDSHAQLEIRQYATIIGEQIVAQLFPTVWEAFQDYRMNAMFLTALDIEAIKTKSLDHFTNGREKNECVAKLERLGINLEALCQD